MVVASAFSPMHVRAQTISNLSVNKNPGNSPNEFSGSSADPSFERTSTIFVGPCASCGTFDSRYAAIVTVDSGPNGASRAEQLVSDYTIAFSVAAPAGYFVDVESRLRGDLNIRSDGGGTAAATIGNVTGTYTGGNLVEGSLSSSDPGSLQCGEGCTDAFAPTAVATLAGTSNGAAVAHTLRFTWSQQATTQFVRGAQGDEAAVRLGGTSQDTSESAGNYPGTPARTQSTDGHFVTVKVRPRNDECSEAVTIGSTPFHQVVQVTQATYVREDPQQSCGAAVFRAGNRSVWYRFTAPANGVLSVDTLGSTYDTVITVSDGTCAVMMELACNDDADEGIVASLVNLPVSAGVTYLIEVAEFGTAGAGGTLDFSLNFTASAPTPTTTSTPTRTATPSQSATHTAMHTPTRSPTSTPTAMRTPSETATSTPSRTLSPTSTPTATQTATNTAMHTLTQSPAATASRTATSSPIPSATATFTETQSRTPTSTPSHSATATSTPTSSLTRTASASSTQTPASTATPTATQAATNTAMHTLTQSPATTASRTATSSPIPSATATFTETQSRTPTSTPSPSATATSTPTSSLTRTASASSTQTPASTATPRATDTLTPSRPATDTPTPVLPSATPSNSASNTPTATQSLTPTPISTFTPTRSTKPNATATPAVATRPAYCLGTPVISRRHGSGGGMPSNGECMGDCDGSGSVTVDELVVGISVALGTTSGSRCLAFDGDGNGAVTVDEIVAAVNAALRGCSIDDASMVALEELRQRSERVPEVQFRDGVLRAALIDVPLSPNLPDDPLVQALTFLHEFKDAYGLSNPAGELFLSRIESEGEEHHLFFGQRHNGLLIFAAELAVHIRDRRVVLTNGRYIVNPVSGTFARITANAAADAALAASTTRSARVIGTPAAVYFDATLLSRRYLAGLHLAWLVSVAGVDRYGVPSSQFIFVSADSGAVIASLSQSPAHAPARDFHVVDSGGGSGSDCWDGSLTSSSHWFDENGEVNYPGAADDLFSDGQDAASAIHDVYDYFFERFHHHSFGGMEETVVFQVHAGNSWRNAQYTHGCKEFFFGDGYVTTDIAAHEFTHGVTHHHANLLYEGEPGALNESFSDIFACLIDGNWTIGEDLISPIRDLANPGLHDQPEHYDQFVYTDGDNGGVHTNSGIPNKAAYLIAEGGFHGGYSVHGIGRVATSHIYYDALTEGLGQLSDFLELRSMLLSKAQMRYGNVSPHACAVRNAFAAIGVYQADTDSDCDGVLDGVEQDDDGDGVADGDDNCVTVANPLQANHDPDVAGDVCDPDDDNDLVPDDADNCRIVSNPNQADSDFDGIGDLCDDSDGDGVIDIEDNCPADNNPKQENADQDALGDDCDPDDDNDTILDEIDNCPFAENQDQQNQDGDDLGDVCDNCPQIENSDQRDCNKNGIGTACDPKEGDIFRALGTCSPGRPVTFTVEPRDLIPIECSSCPDWIPDDFDIRIEVLSDYQGPLEVVDGQGHLVARAQIGADQKFLTYEPRPSFSYSAPGCDDVPFQGTQYSVRIPRGDGPMVLELDLP